MILVTIVVTIGGVALLSALLFWFMPLLTRRDLYFAVTVRPGFRLEPEGKAILQRYRGELALLSCNLRPYLSHSTGQDSACWLMQCRQPRSGKQTSVGRRESFRVVGSRRRGPSYCSPHAQLICGCTGVTFQKALSFIGMPSGILTAGPSEVSQASSCRS